MNIRKSKAGPRSVAMFNTRITTGVTTGVNTGVKVAVLLALLAVAPASVAKSWWETGASIIDSLTAGSDKGDITAAALGSADVSAAFKQALQIGAENVTDQLGQSNGFNDDPLIHIPLPKQFQTVKSVLSTVGMSAPVDDLELKLNRAAEAATPLAKDLFLKSINSMTFDDAMAIYQGPEDSATQYFKSRMTPELKSAMLPIVDSSLAEVGAVQAYDRVMGEYQALPFVPDVKADLTNHVLERALDGVFLYLGKEEAAIRSDPVRQTTALLQRVFGGS
ncbi:MAG: DUF4197 domain-containing protein [Porticoccaceae bacterium]|nr:DUF4197 domain-containing protein [Porticoccaceae bacterium]